LCLQKITFEKSFPLMISEADLLRPQCIHVFALLEPIDKGLLNPYTHDEWIAGIISTMSTVGASMIFADVVCGYIFGVFDLRSHVLVPPVRVSPLERMEGFHSEEPALLPPVLFAIADFPDALCTKCTVL
jgi:hypothetical protein